MELVAAQRRRDRLDGLLGERERQRAVVQHVSQVGGLVLAEVAGDLRGPAGDRALVDGRERDHAAVQHHGQVVQRRGGLAPGGVLAVHLLGQRAERRAARGVEVEVGLPVDAGGRLGGAGRRDLLAQHLRLVQDELVQHPALGAARDGLDVGVVVLLAGVADLLLPVLVRAVELVELGLHRRADQAGVTAGPGHGGNAGAAGRRRRSRRARRKPRHSRWPTGWPPPWRARGSQPVRL